jgi:hypothetical protein
MKRWYSVGDLYTRVRWSMPAGNVGGLSANDNLAIVAYLLATNGLPAGRGLNGRPRCPEEHGPEGPAGAPGQSPRTAERPWAFRKVITPRTRRRAAKNYYYAACGMCHTADRDGPNGLDMPHESGLGWHWGNQWRYGVQGTDAWLNTNSRIAGKPQMWDTVADLYNKVSTTQPAYAINALSDEEYTSIVAYC